jgi:diguanylate cyclase (GGDEF)-like protein
MEVFIMKITEIIIFGIIISESIYLIFKSIKLKSINNKNKELNKKIEEINVEVTNINDEKIEVERKIDEKNFKFLAINQMAKTLAKEKNVNELKKLIMDMLLEVNSVRRGISFQRVNNLMKVFEMKNMGSNIKLEFDCDEDKDICKYLKNNKFLNIRELEKFEKTKEFAKSFSSGYVMTFLVANESGYENINYIVVLGEKSYGEYSEGDGDFYETLIGQIEIILENSLKNSLIESKNAELSEKIYDLLTLNNASKMISATLDIEEIFKNSVDMFTEVAQSTKGCILYYEKELKKLIVKAVKGDYDKSIIGTSIGIEKQTIDYLRENQGGIILTELRENEKELINYYLNNKDFFKKIKSEVMIPLMANEEFIGIILLGMRFMEDGYKTDNMEVFATLGSQIAVSTYNAKLYNMAITDGMTKLYLHRYLQTRLEEELERAKRYKREIAFLMTDIDHFKKFNDTYGHQIGDEVLKKVASIIKERTRKSDIAARYGGEEFAVVLPETSEDGAVQLAEYIRKEIEDSVIEVDGRELKVTISIGVSYFNGSSSVEILKEELIKKADTALYKSKESGRNRVTKYGSIKESTII